MTTPEPPPHPTASAGANSPLVLAAAAVTVLCWASAFIVIRGAGPHFDPGAMALLRMAVGSLVLGIILLRTGFRAPPRRAIPGVITWGTAWFCVYNVALNTAERLIDAGTAAMIVNLAPLMVVLMAGFVLREGFPRMLVVGAPVSFAGVALIGLQSSNGHVAITGLLLALLAAVLYAACTLLQKHLLRTVDSASLTWLGAVAGTVALLPWTPRLISDLQAAPAAATWSVVYMGVFPTAIAFTTWAYVLRRSTAGQTAATTYVVPAVAILMSWALLGETPTVITLVGGTLCLLGVFLTRLPARRR